jgi:DNA-binding PadR family transcriptional regulator
MADASRSRGPFLALLALRDGPKHGYEIAATIQERSQGYFTLSFGSLYPILHKLERDGLVKGAWKDIGEAKGKKVYALTAAGRRALEDETTNFRAMLAAFASLMAGGVKA